MEVPCCGGLPAMTLRALNGAEKEIPMRKVVITRDGRLLDNTEPETERHPIRMIS